MRRTQARVHGPVIRLAAGGRTFEQHKGPGGSPFPCAHRPAVAAEPRAPFALTPRVSETDEGEGLPG